MNLDIQENIEEAVELTENFRSFFNVDDEWYIWIGRDYDQNTEEGEVKYHLDTDESYSRADDELGTDLTDLREELEKRDMVDEDTDRGMQSAHLESSFPYEDIDGDEMDEIYDEWVEQINEEYPDTIVLSE